jgi:hypothetical protein
VKISTLARCLVVRHNQDASKFSVTFDLACKGQIVTKGNKAPDIDGASVAFYEIDSCRFVPGNLYRVNVEIEESALSADDVSKASKGKLDLAIKPSKIDA